jgi:hypothetical protein
MFLVTNDFFILEIYDHLILQTVNEIVRFYNEQSNYKDFYFKA